MKKSTDCNTFSRAGFIEAWGRGIEKIKDSCAEAGKPMPEFVVKKPANKKSSVFLKK